MKSNLEQRAARYLCELSELRPNLAIVLGTGFAGALGDLDVAARVSYTTIPGFTTPGVPGHRGELLLGRLAKTEIVVLVGRSHFYEGHALDTVTFCIRALAAFGVKDLLLTNAAGAIHPAFRPGDFMQLRDHINFMGANPLRGVGSKGGQGFVDLTAIYHPLLNKLLKAAAKACDLKLRSGVYLAVSGPSYETPAEIEAFRRWGADAVGMSTVPEAIVARQCGLRVCALSCLTNRAAGRGRPPLSHDEVLETAARMRQTARKLLFHFVRLYGSRRKIRIEKGTSAGKLHRGDSS